MQFFNFNQTFLLRVRRILKELYSLKFDCDVVTLQYPVFLFCICYIILRITFIDLYAFNFEIF